MKQVLMVIGGTSHPFESCAAIFKEAMEAGGQFSITVTQDRASLADLSGFDAVVMYTVRGEMSEAQEQGLVNFVRAGGGLLAIHCANAGMSKFEAYTEMVGSALTGHGPVPAFDAEFTGDAGDLFPRLSSKVAVMDEFYSIEPRTDAPLRAFLHGTWQFRKVLLGYVRDYGTGKVLYTALGHDERTFRHPDFQDLLFKGLRYVTGLKEQTPIRIGLLGYGPAYQMGKHHSEQIAATEGLELTAVCDRDPARLEAAKEEQGDQIATFTDAEEMAVSGVIDLGVVILPHAYHASAIKTFLNAGLHVITEKPFAITAAECDEVIALARERDVMLSVYHNRHWDPDVLTLRKIVEAGTIGEIYSLECNMVGYGRPGQAWRSHKPISGGVLYDMGAHQFEKILQLLPKSDPEGNPINRRASLYGHFLKKVWHDTTIEDYARAYARFDGGVEAQVVVSSICSASKPLWIVSGTRGSVVIPNWEDNAVLTTVDDAGHRFATEVPQIEGVWGSYYKNVADHLLAGARLIITPEWAKAPIQCIEGCEIAARENRIVEVAFDF
ncbi:MAG: ThuA domain-containing protein [Candidatus Latescibacteria bacterium]|nr:ThuA domain-containing protein [Candidatus Latescibacterota bacterium]